LSSASLALLISSRRNTSRLLYRLFTIMSMRRSTCGRGGSFGGWVSAGRRRGVRGATKWLRQVQWWARLQGSSPSLLHRGTHACAGSQLRGEGGVCGASCRAGGRARGAGAAGPPGSTQKRAAHGSPCSWVWQLAPRRQRRPRKLGARWLTPHPMMRSREPPAARTPGLTSA
jgi:hypothetical protein